MIGYYNSIVMIWLLLFLIYLFISHYSLCSLLLKLKLEFWFLIYLLMIWSFKQEIFFNILFTSYFISFMLSTNFLNRFLKICYWFFFSGSSTFLKITILTLLVWKFSMEWIILIINIRYYYFIFTIWLFLFCLYLFNLKKIMYLNCIFLFTNGI